MEMQEATPKQRANWLIRHQITEVISAMKEAEYSAEWKQNKRSYLMGVADALYHMELATVMEHSCLLYTSPSPRDGLLSRMPSSA